MIRKSSDYPIPHGNTTVWRYMGLEKFLDLLANSYIRFTRASLLSDQSELALFQRQLEDEYFRLKRGSVNLNVDFDKNFELHDRLDALRERIKDLKDRVYLNSWSITPNESYALWKIYLGGATAGVAIKTSISALLTSFEISKSENTHIQVGKIEYSSQSIEKSPLDDVDFILNKSSFYDYEKEMRLFSISSPNEKKTAFQERLIQTLGPSQDLALKVDLKTLIHEIYVSPFMISNFRRTLHTIIQKIQPDLDFPIRNSSVQDR